MKINEFTKIDPEKDIENVFLGDIKRSSEPDTEMESKILDVLRKFIGADPGELPRAETYKLLKQLEKIKNLYPDDLIPKAEYVYRGTKVKKKVYDYILDNFDIDDLPDIIEAETSYTPKSNIQSWSTDYDIAEDFSLNHKMSYHWTMDDFKSEVLPAVIKAKVDSTFILSSKLTNLISVTVDDIQAEESEIIRLSKRPIKVDLLLNNDMLTTYERVWEK